MSSGYFKVKGLEDKKYLDANARFIYTLIFLKVTEMILAMTSWFLANKALKSGEITEEQLNSRRYELLEIKDFPEKKLVDSMKDPIPEIYNRAKNLYDRIKRIN